MKIFLLSGKTSSGKNEVAKLIKEYYVYNYKKCAITNFEKNIEKFVKELTEWNGNELTKVMKDFQEIGAKIREINSDYLVNNMMQDIAIYENFVDNVIIADVKLPNEIETFQNYFDDVISINVENQFKANELSVEEQIDITEIALENFEGFDYILINDNIDTLKDKVFKILEEVK
ncbi:MAG: hypothetical protein R3Y13_00225 [bacterium]